MKKLITILTVISFLVLSAYSQAPQAFKYQAVARNTQGNIIPNEEIDVRISIIREENAVYIETFRAYTNSFGLFVLSIGNGDTVLGTFEDIDWSLDYYFLQVEVADPSEGAYQILGRTKLQSVPYALYAEKAATVDNIDDADADSTNELQNLSLDGTELSLSDGNTVDLAGLPDEVEDADADPVNELQNLDLSSDTLYITDGNYVILPSGIGDNQTLTLSNDTLYLERGGNVYLGNYFTSSGDTVDLIGKTLIINNIISGGNPISTIDSGLVAYYPFNGNANDESGNGNNGTVNGAVLTTDRFGNVSSAYYFDGSNDGIGLGNIINASNLTIAAWVKKGESSFVKMYNTILSGDCYAPLLDYCLDSIGFGGQCNQPMERDRVVKIIDTSWHFIVASYDGTYIKLFVDNIEYMHNNIGYMEFNTSVPVGLGYSYGNSYSDYFWGKIDDVRIYDRAITTSEINNLYHEGNYDSQLKFYDPVVGEVILSDLKNDFNNGGDSATAIRTLGNKNAYGLGFLTNNHTNVFIDENGNVGIGTTNPDYPLHIFTSSSGVSSLNTNASFTLESSSAGYISFATGDIAETGILFSSPTGGESDGRLMYITNVSDRQLQFFLNGSNRMVIDQDGNVGIGTNSPGGLLGLKNPNTYIDVDGSNNLTFTDAVTGTKTMAELAAGGSGFWNTATGGIHYSSGDVGIGTTEPESKLHINTNETYSQILNSTVDDHGLVLSHNGTYQAAVRLNGNNGLAFLTSGAHIGNDLRMSILNNGNVGINTSSPFAKLTLKGGSGDTTFATINSSNDTTMVVLDNGNVGIGTTSPNEKLEVDGTIYSTSGGIKFPDGTTQTTASSGGMPIPILLDEFDRDALDEQFNNDWTPSTTGNGDVLINYYPSLLTLQSGSGGSGSALVYGNRSFSVSDGTLKFKAKLISYEDPAIYGDYQPRGLVNGTDRNNAIEFISASSTSVYARTVNNGSVTQTLYSIGNSVKQMNYYLIIATPTIVRFYVNGNLAATHTTNIPTTTLNCYLGTSYSGGGNVSIHADYVSFEIIK